jgi:bacterioferritin
MQGDKKVIAHLNAQLKMELTAVNQYFLHYRMLKNWGFERLAKFEHDESIDEMKHADRIIERVLMIGGLPNLQDLGKLLIGETVVEILQCDLKAERGGQAHLKDAIEYCESVRDYVSRELFEEILSDTEHHVDHLETQLELVEKVGETDRNPLADCAQQFIGNRCGVLRHLFDRQLRSPQHGLISHGNCSTARCGHIHANHIHGHSPGQWKCLPIDQYR